MLGKKQNKLFLQKKINEDLEFQLQNVRVEVQEETLTTISKELHDNIGQLLSSAKMLLAVALKDIDSSKKILITTEETISKAASDLRSLSKVWDKDWINRFSLVDNLSNEIARGNKSKHICYNFSCQCFVTINPDKQLILYRIIQESMQNAIKHANPTKIDVYLEEVNGYLVTRISDNGDGFDLDNTRKGSGMVNIENRVRLLRGYVKWESSINIGTCLTVGVPNKII